MSATQHWCSICEGKNTRAVFIMDVWIKLGNLMKGENACLVFLANVLKEKQVHWKRTVAYLLKKNKKILIKKLKCWSLIKKITEHYFA